jgi:hypothetical protein
MSLANRNLPFRSRASQVGVIPAETEVAEAVLREPVALSIEYFQICPTLESVVGTYRNLPDASKTAPFGLGPVAKGEFDISVSTPLPPMLNTEI